MRCSERVNGLDDLEFPICGEEYDLAERGPAPSAWSGLIVREARVLAGNVSEDPGEQLVRSTLAHGGERTRLMARLTGTCLPAPYQGPAPLHDAADLRPPVGGGIGRLVLAGQSPAPDPNGDGQSHRSRGCRGIPGGSALMTVITRNESEAETRAERPSLNIVAVSWRNLAHPAAGGAEVLLDRVLNGLHERGHGVSLVCGGPLSQHRYEAVDSGGTYSQYLRAPAICTRRFRDADIVIDVQNGMPYFSPLWRRRPSVCVVHHVHTDQWATRFAAGCRVLPAPWSAG